MCINVFTEELGPADAGLHARARVLVLSPRLTSAERIAAARRLLIGAGYGQAGGHPAEVTCLCGRGLDVTPPNLHVAGPRRPSAAFPGTAECLAGATS